MPRAARKCPGGMIYHVLNRSVARIKLFRGEKDYLSLMATLSQAQQRFPVDLLSYCVMPNHWHLVLRPREDGQLSEFMHWFTMTHVQRWRTSHQTVGFGPLYQGRFKAFAIERDRHLLTVLRYVERNALRAKLVRRAEDWRWSSLHVPALAEEGVTLPSLSAWPIPRPSDWLDRVNTPQTPAEEKAIQESINRSRPFGSPTWQLQAARELKLTSCFRQPGRPWSKESSRK